MTSTASIISWVCRIAVAIILLQTLFFKFTGAEESVYIFSTLGAEPWGRLASGAVELAAAALLVYSPTAAIGATLALGTMAGAILSHLTILGIEIKDDGGLLFGLALIVFVASGAIVFLRRADLPVVGRYFEVAL